MATTTVKKSDEESITTGTVIRLVNVTNDPPRVIQESPTRTRFEPGQLVETTDELLSPWEKGQRDAGYLKQLT